MERKRVREIEKTERETLAKAATVNFAGVHHCASPVWRKRSGALRVLRKKTVEE